MSTTIDAIVKNRIDTAADWTANNPVLLEGQVGYESDTSKYKLGDGSTAWNSLGYHCPVVATGAEIDTGTDDEKFASPLAIQNSGILSTTKDSQLTGLANLATPLDTDLLLVEDQSAGGAKKYSTWANIKATLKSYFDSVTTTLTNKTISGASNTITGLKTGYISFGANTFNPADATVYYFGVNSNFAPTTTAGIRRIYFPYNCTITGVSFDVYCTAGDNANVTFNVQVNGGSTTAITTTAQLTSTHNFISNTSLSIAITAGDYVEIQQAAVTWGTTNPTNVIILGGLIHIQ